MPRALIFGSNLGTSALTRSLKREGYRCTVLGHDPNQVGAIFADEFHIIDYNDVESVPSGVLNTSFDLVIPGAHDLCFKAYCSFLDSVKVAEGTTNEINHLSAFESLHNKTIFRARLAEIAPHRSPPYYQVSEVSDPSRLHPEFFPALFKPAHAGGGRGIRRFNTKEEFVQEFRTLSLQSGLVEKIFPGVDVSISLWLCEDVIENWYADREFSELRHFHISGSLSNNNFIAQMREMRVIDELAFIISKLGYKNGFTHCQIRVDSDLNWNVVEFTRRLPGDLYQLVPDWFGGFDYVKNYIASFDGRKSEGPVEFRFNGSETFGRVCLTQTHSLEPPLYKLAAFQSHIKTSRDSYELCLIKCDSTLDLFDPSLNLLRKK